MRSAALWRGLLAAVLAAGTVVAPLPSAARDRPPRCGIGDRVRITGRVGPGFENSYLLLPFVVRPGVGKLRITYSYSDGTPRADDTVLDLGLYDPQGAFSYEGFRGWSGSRQGNVEAGQKPVVVTSRWASRNYIAEPIQRGRWHVELGGGAVSDNGARYEVEIACKRGRRGRAPRPDPVNPDHVANPEPGWYFGDFHMHAYNSNPNGPTQKEFVEYARAAGLDFLPITEYQINRHWTTWGRTARANPDLLFWPGREVITYYGHAGVIGETFGMVEYRHGFRGVSMADIQAASHGPTTLFQINHPTTFPEPTDELCRGCAWELDAAIDYDLVDTVEVVNVGVYASFGGGTFPNPFVETALDFWEQRLLDGHMLTAVGGSDDKLGPRYGIPATAVYAEELSRRAVAEAVRAGRVWIAARGVHDSPRLDFTATDGEREVMFGGTLQSPQATFTARVQGGAGHTLHVIRDGVEIATVPVTSDDFTHTFVGTAGPGAGPLGSFIRVETRAPDGLLSTLGNPIFLKP